ncbi:nucleotidyltransferase [Streptomyces sp. CHD11]|uniref:hypothetical protein n=1 Tax=Streptomyces sp. CHD11 TaxID=2741325 RepID=UPI001BFC6956|nr:hypothetical protein [Streptomyces sp. CHD11]MBT3152733.1 nucleotidyltransferase [Streptomyces sp. CHD11]
MLHGRGAKFQPGAAERQLEPLLLTIDRRIAITDNEYAEAKERLNMLSSALAEGFGQEVYVNGSIAHGDALSPLSDIDLGVVLGEPWAARERRHSPGVIMKRACEVIETLAGKRYPGISADFAEQKRAVVVQFGDAKKSYYDFTADVIVALDYREGRGVLIPNLQRQGWDRSDPIRHSELIRLANASSDLSFNAVVRIVKQWNRATGQPLSSWNIKALALSCITRPTTLTEGLYTFFHYAKQALSSGLTPDPAGIGPPIGLEMRRSKVLAYLNNACDAFDRVIENAASGRLLETCESLREIFPAVHVFSDCQRGSGN